MQPRTLQEYHVFLASPSDTDQQRQAVRNFFGDFNRQIGSFRGVQFSVIDWENYSTIGVGRPQELITAATLERFSQSLVLVIGILAQRFGSPTGTHESGTIEEFEWAKNRYEEGGFPEIKWFFKKVEQFQAPSDPERIQEALEQWKQVLGFRERLRSETPPLFYREFADAVDFQSVLRNDLMLWLNDSARPWNNTNQPAGSISAVVAVPPTYYQQVVNEFRWLDISGIDNDRAFSIPLDKVYVRLRVALSEEAAATDKEAATGEGVVIDIQTALERFRKLVIVGDPGSGKSTFLKFIALMIARSQLEGNPSIATSRLSLQSPLPIPLFISLWELADYIRGTAESLAEPIVSFTQSKLEGVPREQIEQLLSVGSFCLLFDGLDEVPTEIGRAKISRIVETFVQKFHTNRFVITSRVRAYTGDAILRGDFSRCDIQEFDEADRSEFLKSWFSLLFKLSSPTAFSPSSEAHIAHSNLTESIESKDRIRALAVNPLLLTVIAIVHWNRKRLPEQRVDLYDECVDVLLGQRKEAERIQMSKTSSSLDEHTEDNVHYERKWVRKRFSEIALELLRSDEEEITRQEVIELLIPRFVDRGANDVEKAETDANTFLERQELRSGLLVSRAAHRYRFVHLTFQEYLAAWNLSTRELQDAKRLIQANLREPEWFETLQLLGAELGKRSDESLDSYIAYLLDQLGNTIAEQAPIIALCANIINDVAGVAEVTPPTRQHFQAALKNTLGAFMAGSGVSAKTQLEILTPLAKLGAAVKEHLISATKSAYYPVRAAALSFLAPHLPDNDLFGMTHVLSDRSMVTIRTYLSVLFRRDAERTIAMLAERARYSEKCSNVVTELLPTIMSRATEVEVFAIAGLAADAEWWARPHSLQTLASLWPDRTSTWEFLAQYTRSSRYWFKRQAALNILINAGKDTDADWDSLRNFIEKGGSLWYDEELKFLLKHKGQDPTTWKLINRWAVEHRDDSARSACLTALARERRLEAATWSLITLRSTADPARDVRTCALELLWRSGRQSERPFVAERAQSDPDPLVRLRIARLVSGEDE